MATETRSQNNLAYEMLTAEFPASEVKSFNGAKPGKPPRYLSYVPDETVMDRLDAVFGPGCWTVTVAPTPTPTVAVVTLSVKWPDNDEWSHYSDFGYPTNGETGEALKEAAGDGIRRCARYLGVARYIYAGHVDAAPPPQQQRPAPQRPAAPPADDSGWDMREIDERATSSEANCAKHGVAWAGTPYDPNAERSGRYHKDGVWEDSGKTKWCRHPADEAAKKGQRR